MKRSLLLSILISCLVGCDSDEATDENEEVLSTVPLIQYEETNFFLHDTTLFTEGLLMHNGELFESTGSPDTNRRSMIGVSDLKKRNFVQKIELDNKKYFGEGIVFMKDKLYQLTYKTQTGFIYDASTFKLLNQFRYSNKEGWALTTDGTHLIMSDGTDTLTYLNPNTLKPDKYLRVTENGIRRDSLNELEFVKGYIFANVWLSNYIVKIDPTDGKVVGKLDLNLLAFKARTIQPYCDVLNGIAYDSTIDALYVTGKLWPYIYQIKLTPQTEAKK